MEAIVLTDKEGNVIGVTEEEIVEEVKNKKENCLVVTSSNK